MIEKILEILDRYENILILGFGREWQTSYNFIRKYLPNKKVTILDENQIWKIDDEKADVIIEKITIERLRQFDLIVKTPWISFKWMDTEWLNITSQLELLLEVDRDNVIWITGTKGKSTTTALLYEVVKNQKENTFLLWNIWVPIFEQIENFDNDSTLVIECSSHQLQYIKTSPHIAILLNLYPEHLDHYNNLQEYYDSKLNIFKYQTEWDFAIFDEQVTSLVPLYWRGVAEGRGIFKNPYPDKSSDLSRVLDPGRDREGSSFLKGAQSPTIFEIGKDILVQWDFVMMNRASLSKGGADPEVTNGEAVGFYKQIPSIPLNKGDSSAVGWKFWIPPTHLHKGDSMIRVYNVNEKRNLLWEHNLRNIMNIFVVCEILKLDLEKAKQVIAKFQPLEHRMELVWTFDWVTYYNDSIATIPASTINSLKSIPNVNTLILWWMDRWIDYSDLINFVNGSDVENVICLPKTGHDILPSITKKTYKVEDLPQAVEFAKQVTKKWFVCLLSPAASSYTFFKNFEERGKMFKELVKE